MTSAMTYFSLYQASRYGAIKNTLILERTLAAFAVDGLFDAMFERLRLMMVPSLSGRSTAGMLRACPMLLVTRDEDSRCKLRVRILGR